jgi:threonyl-tRNA synthetase
MERFIGILIEHFAGAFPLWLAPEQVRVIPIRDKYADYGRKVEAQLRAAGLRVSGDYRAEDMRPKIRNAELEKIPYMLIVGEKEQTAGTVAVRDHVDGDLGAMPVAELLARLDREIKEKRIRQVSTATAGLTDSGAKFGD